MITIEHVVTPSPEQMDFIIEGIRNPFNSWEKSDSHYICEADGNYEVKYKIGPKDLKLMSKLSETGTDHRKFMRMMTVCARITAPLYWWKEFDTYKIGTTSNSCSTMHKISDKEFTVDDFSVENLLMYSGGRELYFSYPNDEGGQDKWISGDVIHLVIEALNFYRNKYLETRDKNYWWQMIQLLPSSYNQTRNVTMNYEVLTNIYYARMFHQLDEWRDFCTWIESLPYSKELILHNKS